MKKCILSLVKVPFNKTILYRAHRTLVSSTPGQTRPSDTKVSVEESKLKKENIGVASDIGKSKPFHQENRELGGDKKTEDISSPGKAKHQINKKQETSTQEENQEYGLDRSSHDFSEEAEIRTEDFIGKFAQTKKYRGNEVEEVPGSKLDPKLNYISGQTPPDYKKVHDDFYKEFKTPHDMGQQKSSIKESVQHRTSYPDENLSDIKKKEMKRYFKDKVVEYKKSGEWAILIETDVVPELLGEQIIYEMAKNFKVNVQTVNGVVDEIYREGELKKMNTPRSKAESAELSIEDRRREYPLKLSDAKRKELKKYFKDKIIECKHESGEWALQIGIDEVPQLMKDQIIHEMAINLNVNEGIVNDIINEIFMDGELKNVPSPIAKDKAHQEKQHIRS